MSRVTLVMADMSSRDVFESLYESRLIFILDESTSRFESL